MGGVGLALAVQALRGYSLIAKSLMQIQIVPYGRPGFDTRVKISPYSEEISSVQVTCTGYSAGSVGLPILAEVRIGQSYLV